MEGTLHCPNGATIGMFEDTCTFSCNAGYELQGSNNGTCLANQSWSGGDPECTLLCPDGQVNCSRANNCAFSCDPGYMLQRNVTNRFCENIESGDKELLSSGSGNGRSPSCVPLSCSSMIEVLEDGITVMQASSSCGQHYQSQCTISCDEGFTGDDVTYLCNVTSDPTMVDWVPIDGVDMMCERGLHVSYTHVIIIIIHMYTYTCMYV